MLTKKKEDTEATLLPPSLSQILELVLQFQLQLTIPDISERRRKWAMFLPAVLRLLEKNLIFRKPSH